MKLENIRPNFTFADESTQRQMFLEYYDRREADFNSCKMVTVKQKKTSIKTGEKFTVNKDQLALLKLLGLC